MIEYKRLAQAMLVASARPVESGLGRSMLEFARGLGLGNAVDEALRALPDPSGRSDDDRYAWEMRKAFRALEKESSEAHRRFTLFANNLARGCSNKAAAETYGERLLTARDFHGNVLVRSERARTHIEALLDMLAEIGEHHLYEPWRWNEYIEAALHDLGTHDYIANAVLMAMMGSDAISVQKLARRLNGMALKAMASPGARIKELEKACLAMGNVLREGPTPALLDAMLDVWTLVVDARTDVLAHFASERPRSGFFHKRPKPEDAEGTPCDLRSIAKRTIPEFCESTPETMHPCFTMIVPMTAAPSDGAASIIAPHAGMDGTLSPCTVATLACSGLATFSL